MDSAAQQTTPRVVARLTGVRMRLAARGTAKVVWCAPQSVRAKRSWRACSLRSAQRTFAVWCCFVTVFGQFLICYYYYWLLCCRWYVMLSVWMLRRKTHRSPAHINRWSVSWRIVNTLHSTEVESRIMRS